MGRGSHPSSPASWKDTRRYQIKTRRRKGKRTQVIMIKRSKYSLKQLLAVLKVEPPRPSVMSGAVLKLRLLQVLRYLAYSQTVMLNYPTSKRRIIYFLVIVRK